MLRSKSLRTASVAAIVAGAAAGIGAPSAAHAAGSVQRTSLSGITYTIAPACATATMTVNSSSVPRSKPTTVTISNGMGLYGEDYPLGSVYSSIHITATSDFALDPTGLTIKENGVFVMNVKYADVCPGYAMAQATAARSVFTPLNPMRILDTRPTAQIGYTGGKPAAGQSIELAVVGQAGVAGNATAVVLNVTATDATKPGYVQVFPTALSSPGASSNLNIERVGQTIPNAVVVPVGAGGRITLFTEAGTHLIADVAGYFSPGGVTAKAGRYLPVEPSRVLDTRNSARGYSGPKPAAGAVVRVSAIAGVSKAPDATQISAVALNLTATDATAAGFVQIAAAGQLVPGAASSLNLERAGQTIPNLVIAPLSASGEVDIYTEAGTHLIADVVGYFTSANAPSAAAGMFVPAAPERVLDSRTPIMIGAGSYGGDTAKSSAWVDFSGLPARGVGAVMLNVTATNATAGGYVQVGPEGLTVGAHSNLNIEPGQTIANAVISPVDRFTGGIRLYNDGASDLLADFAGWFTA